VLTPLVSVGRLLVGPVAWNGSASVRLGGESSWEDRSFGTVTDRLLYVGLDRGMITSALRGAAVGALLGLVRRRTKFCLCDNLVLVPNSQLLVRDADEMVFIDPS
jgi:hypothetical protein